MANEIQEFNRYWESCCGRLILPKSNSPRLFTFIDLRGEGRNPRPEDVVRVNALAASGDWRTKSYTWADFTRQCTLYTPKSQFMNSRVACVYYSHDIARQFAKGITTTMFNHNTLLLENIVPRGQLWEPEQGDDGQYNAEHFSIWTYAVNYDQPYPSFNQIYQEVIDGRRLAGAFSRTWALYNLRDVKYPVLYRYSVKAGLIHNNTIYLLDAHGHTAEWLRRRTRLPVNTAKELDI